MRGPVLVVICFYNAMRAHNVIIPIIAHIPKNVNSKYIPIIQITGAPLNASNQVKSKSDISIVIILIN